jgi:hypothetical protein
VEWIIKLQRYKLMRTKELSQRILTAEEHLLAGLDALSPTKLSDVLLGSEYAAVKEARDIANELPLTEGSVRDFERAIDPLR